MIRLEKAIRTTTARIPWPILVPLLTAALVYAGYSIAQAARFEYSYSAAGWALEREDFDGAGEHLAICLRLQPNSGRARFRAAQTARRSEQPELTEEHLAACTELSWPAASIEFERMMLAFQRGEGDSAMEMVLRKCIATENPDRYLVLEALAQGYIRTYRLVPALYCLDDWLAAQPESRGALMRRAWVYDRLDRFSDAEADYRAVLGQRPNDAAARLRLAQMLRQQERWPKPPKSSRSLRKTQLPPRLFPWDWRNVTTILVEPRMPGGFSTIWLKSILEMLPCRWRGGSFA